MTLVSAGPIVLVGAGKMGGALLEGWLARGLAPRNVFIQDPNPTEDCQRLAGDHAIALNRAPADIPDPALLLLAVKPQVMDQVLAGLGDLVRPGTVVVSIAAGRTLSSLSARLGADAAIIRTIPNTPAAVGRGVTVAFANEHVSAAQRDLAGNLLAAVGIVEWVGEEALIDAATAVSGSGPAYVFYLAECLAEAGIAAGLPEELAHRIARATVEGAGELLHRSPLPPATLRANVTSPGGTTAAALEILGRDPGLPELMKRAVAAAARRARELAQ